MSAPTQTADIRWMIDAQAELDRLRPVVAHVAGLGVQAGYAMVSRALVEDARRALAGEPRYATAEELQAEAAGPDPAFPDRTPEQAKADERARLDTLGGESS